MAKLTVPDNYKLYMFMSATLMIVGVGGFIVFLILVDLDLIFSGVLAIVCGFGISVGMMFGLIRNIDNVRKKSFISNKIRAVLISSFVSSIALICIPPLMDYLSDITKMLPGILFSIFTIEIIVAMILFNVMLKKGYEEEKASK